MRVKWAAAAAVGFAAIALGAYKYMSRVPDAPAPIHGARPDAPGRPVQSLAREENSSLGAVKVSDTVLDFGQVPLGYPAKQTLVVFNGGVAEVEIAGAGLSAPFHAQPGRVVLASKSSAGFEVSFDPEQPGLFEQRLRLESPPGDPLDVLVRGEAIPSPMSAGIEVPPPPDAALREYQDEAARDLIAQYRPVGSLAGDARQEERADEADDEDASQIPAAARSAGDSASSMAEKESRAKLAAAVVAFGFVQRPSEDLNSVPAPIPPGDTKPDLPPPTDASQGGQDSQNTGDSSEDSDSEGGDETGEDSGGDTGDDGTSSEANPPAEKKIIPTFTVAPNSSVLVYSSREPLSLQTFPVRATSDGSVFEIDGRIRFPELALAFGEMIGLKQWGNARGVVTPDGNVEIGLTLRLDDPGGALVLDLPIQMTTRMTVGYSAEGRLMFANGVPRDPATGDFKLVGIANIPLGAGGSLDKAPVYVELLGRLTM